VIAYHYETVTAAVVCLAEKCFYGVDYYFVLAVGGIEDEENGVWGVGCGVWSVECGVWSDD